MDSLPIEMLEYILCCMDGRSLIRAKAVCKTWNDVATLFDKKQSHWKSLCYKEISRVPLLEYALKKYPYWRPNRENDGQLNWKDLYLTWLHWKVLNCFQYYNDILSEHKTCCVTCLKLVGNSIVVGLLNGEIKSWKARGGDPYLLSTHRSKVTSLDVLSILDERKEVTADNELDYILSTSDDKIVKVSYFIDEDMIPNFFDIYHHEHSTIMVRALQSYFATLDESGAIAVFLVTAPNQDDILPAVYLVAEYQPSVPPILTLNIWGSKVSGMTKEGTFLSADFLKREDTMKVECTPENGTVHVTVVENASSYVNDHKILISLNGNEYYEYNFENILNTYATTAFLYGNLLIFGLESGSVVMYYFEAPEELLHLDLQCYHWLHPVANEPVITMDVCENSSGPLLAVLCHTNVHLIEWSCTMDDFINDNGKEVQTDQELDYPLLTSDEEDEEEDEPYFIEEGMIPNFLDTYHHPHSNIMVRPPPNYFAPLGGRGPFAMFDVFPPLPGNVFPPVYFFAGYHPYGPPVLPMNIWGNMVPSMLLPGPFFPPGFLRHHCMMKSPFPPDRGIIHVTVVENFSPYESKVYHYKGTEMLRYDHWSKNIFIWITHDHMLLISPNGNEYYEYNVEKVLNTYPTAALLHGNLLILGLQSGSVVMYCFETPEDLLFLDLQSYHWLQPVANEPVVKMDICHSSSGPLLVVFSHTDVYLVDWSCNMDDFNFDEVDI